MCMCTLIYLNSQSSAVNKVSSSRRIPESSSSQYQVLKFKKKHNRTNIFFQYNLSGKFSKYMSYSKITCFITPLSIYYTIDFRLLLSINLS